MWHIPIVLAHGALGPYDEVIIPVIGGAFIGLIVITWLSSRNRQDEAEEMPPPDRMAPDAPAKQTDDPSHYRLE